MVTGQRSVTWRAAASHIQNRCDFLLPCLTQSSSVRVEGHCKHMYVGVRAVTIAPVSVVLAVWDTMGDSSRMFLRIAL